MGYYDAYTSDGSGPTRLYPMWQDVNGDWTYKTSYYTDLQFYDPWDNEKVGPRMFNESFEEVMVIDDPRVDGRVYKRSAGFRYHLSIEWPTCTLDNRGNLVGIINSGLSGRVRVMPHNDVTSIYYDCVISNFDIMSKEMIEGIIYPSYNPSIELIGVEIIDIIPHSWNNYHYFYCAKGSWGAYTTTEKQRLGTMRNKAVWATYLNSDYKGFYCYKKLKTDDVVTLP